MGFFLLKRIIRTRCAFAVLIILFSAGQVTPASFVGQEERLLIEVLNEISREYHVYFTYDSDMIRGVTVDYEKQEGESVRTILTNVLSEVNLGYQIFEEKFVIIYREDEKGLESLQKMIRQMESIVSDKKARIKSREKMPVGILKRESLLSLSHKRLIRDIKGLVTDSNDEPLIGVNILVKGSNKGTTTDFEGRFFLSDVDDQAVLIISYIGYKSQEVSINGRTSLTIIMQEDAQTLDEVVVVGYGTQKKVNLTGSVQNITSEDIVRRNASNISNALQGLIPGVSIVQSSGKPGADGASVRIRGTGSLNSSSNPLILIDGVEGDINNIDPNAVESISVLKDAASASIYGSRASNGVILITTKRAQQNDLRVSYNGYVGYNSPTEMPEPVSAIKYMEAINLARANSDMDPQYSEDLINEYRTLGADNFNRFDTDWRGKVIKRNALTHNNSFNVSGGSENIKFFGNAGYYYQDGSIVNNDYERITLRLNVDAKLADWIKIGTDVNIRQSKTRQPSLSSPESIIQKATTYPSVFSGLNDDGTWGYGQNGDNPIAIAEAAGLRKAISPELGLKGFVQLNPFKDLEIYSSYSTRRLETKSDYFIKPYETYESGVYKTSFPADGTTKYEGWDQLITNQFNLQADYSKVVQNNYFKFLAGFQTEEKLARSFSATRKGYAYDGFEDIDHGDITTANNNGSHWAWSMLSFYSRFNYNYKERYLLELNGRGDASSRFMQNYRWGFFPSASAGWRISEEGFFEPLRETVSNLKLRGSFGTLGNQEIYSYFPYAATISPGYGYWFDEELGSGVAQTQVANESITWEKSSQMNLGLDVSVISKLDISFDYYIRTIDDMLQQFPIPLYVGFSSPWENAGSMRNKGWDFSLTWRDNIGTLNYFISGNFSDVKNRVTNLYGNEYVGTQITREGDPIRSWYGYLTDGYFQSQDEIENLPVYGERKNVKPGYVKYLDISGPDGIPDGIIDNFDRTIIGDPSPRYEFSSNIGMDWKGVDFSIFLQGVGKKDIFYSGRGARPFYIGGTIFQHQLDNWTEDNRNASYPLLLIDGSGSNPNNIISDFWVKNGAYLRIKNIMIGYTLPPSFVNRAGFNKARIYFNAQNLLTISNAYKGYDPEISVEGGLFYPVMRTVTFGLDIKL